MNFDFTETDKSLHDIHDFLKKEYLQISTGRANPALLDGVQVESYGSYQPIKNIASINLEDARTMNISPWDKSQIKDIEKALVDSGLPFSISVGDTGVRVHVPQMTEESKIKIVKLIKEKLEDARVKIRSVRQDAMKKIDLGESNGDFAEDDKKRLQEELQKKIDTANTQAEEIFKRKEQDIMSV
ncbi:ribosome recycling factor [Candidatus Campbellbacteria bacterium]|nr:ribosome recycling factor [Candidatus Campbellbacteria bacterium]|tara:strand:- start:270 stop:824 length:555 start_codon:yes stop_codon:yes gene_type:complete